MNLPDVHRPIPNNVAPFAIEAMPNVRLVDLADRAASAASAAHRGRERSLWSAFADPGDYEHACAALDYWRAVHDRALAELADRLRHAEQLARRAGACA